MKTKPLSYLCLAPKIVELHYVRPLYKKMIYIQSSRDAHAVFRLFINHKQLDLKESFWVILLTIANRVIAISEVASGSTVGVVINTKAILQLALLTNASAIIIAHNHPSGRLQKSSKDKHLTQKLKKVAKVIDITLLDHIIITSESFSSFSDDSEL